jgi:kinesin family protein 3/17
MDPITPTIQADNSVHIVVRVRPPSQPDQTTDTNKANSIHTKANSIHITDPMAATLKQTMTRTFNFDQVFHSNSTQVDIYNSLLPVIMNNVTLGYNVSIFAYGQTGSGKTHTMTGTTITDDDDDKGTERSSIQKGAGIIPRIAKQLFTYKSARIAVSALELYDEKVRDLLSSSNNLQIRESKAKGVHVENLTVKETMNFNDMRELLRIGASRRATGSTSMNNVSSRSHCVVTIHFMSKRRINKDDGDDKDKDKDKEDNNGIENEEIEEEEIQSKIQFIDLAGSERIANSQVTGQRLNETKNINKSLSALGNVISALASSSNKQHIPFRNSKLTYLLQDSLAGNAKTIMIATVSPEEKYYTTSLQTLQFVERMKLIQYKMKINIIRTKQVENDLIETMKKEIVGLKIELKDMIEKNKIYQHDIVLMNERQQMKCIDLRNVCLTLQKREETITEMIQKSKEEKDKKERQGATATSFEMLLSSNDDAINGQEKKAKATAATVDTNNEQANKAAVKHKNDNTVLLPSSQSQSEGLIQQEVVVTNIKEENKCIVEWMYIDKKGRERGPYPSLNMKIWNENHHLPSNLLIYSIDVKTGMKKNARPTQLQDLLKHNPSLFDSEAAAESISKGPIKGSTKETLKEKKTKTKQLEQMNRDVTQLLCEVREEYAETVSANRVQLEKSQEINVLLEKEYYEMEEEHQKRTADLELTNRILIKDVNRLKSTQEKTEQEMLLVRRLSLLLATQKIEWDSVPLN